MTQFYNHNRLPIPVFHFQGDSLKKYPEYIEEISKKRIEIPQNISLITFCNKPNIQRSPLIRQLTESNVNFLNPAENIDEWTNTMKPSLLLSAIDKVDTEYVMILDSFDVVLDFAVANIINRFKIYGKEVLFGATKNNYPKTEIDIVEKRNLLGEFKYLNAGTCLGFTDRVREFYQKTVEIADKVYNPLNKEQMLIRIVFNKNQDWVGFDYKSNCFQTMDKTRLYNDTTNNVVIIN